MPGTQYWVVEVVTVAGSPGCPPLSLQACYPWTSLPCSPKLLVSQ